MSNTDQFQKCTTGRYKVFKKRKKVENLGYRAIGEEYEQLLYKKAQEALLSFQSENDLRSKGYDKTPDLKLNVPIAVDGFVVNWIESKGLFGDQSGHRSYISEQYSSYWNR